MLHHSDRKMYEIIAKNRYKYIINTMSSPESYRHNINDDNYAPHIDGYRYMRVTSDAPYDKFTRIYNIGERGSGIRARGEPQDFYDLREKLLADKKLFEDPMFPANYSSLKRKIPGTIKWNRPKEIVREPLFFVDGASRFDIVQGELGDCWVLAAVANLTLNPPLFEQIVPSDNSFQNKYAGIFHFRFWQFGRWVDVVVDDRLPTLHNKLVFMHSSEPNEFWSALFEKAYAKLTDSYEKLSIGSTADAMQDFTGGISEVFGLDHPEDVLFTVMTKAHERCSMMAASIEPDPLILELQTPQGLVKGHAYSITDVRDVVLKNEINNSPNKIRLIRLRNPWGNEVEWNGPWSDESKEWQYIPEREKKELGLVFQADGEFWMSYYDFATYFSRLEMCNLHPDSLADELEAAGKKWWECNMFEGEWVPGVSAGGCRNFIETFPCNPQFTITLTEPDEKSDMCTVIIGLVQKDRRRLGAECLAMGFSIYHIRRPDKAPKPLDKNFFLNNKPIARSIFSNLREIPCRLKLPRGVYCIVPSTFLPNEQAEFLLRVFSEKENNLEEHDHEIGITKVDQRAHIVAMEKKKDELERIFFNMAREDLEITWQDLKKFLDKNLEKESRGKGFSKDICRSLIAMMDFDRSGKLGYDEFKILWTSILQWKEVFILYDKDDNGVLDMFELRDAFSSSGFVLNNYILNILAHRYGTENCEMLLDDFILCAMRLKGMIDLFNEHDPHRTKEAKFTMEEWIERTLYS